MDFFEAAQKRYSYRSAFTDAPVPQADLEKMLLAAIQAATGYNLQTTSYVVVTNADTRAKLAEILPGVAVETAPVLIVAVSEAVTGQNGMQFEVEDYAASVENLLLAMTALGYAGVWMDGMTRSEGRVEKIAQLLQLPAGQNVRAIIPCGVPQQPGSQKEKKPLAQRVRFIG